MVDAEDLTLLEPSAQVPGQVQRALEVVAERLLDHESTEAVVLVGEAHRAQTVGDGFEQ